MTLQASALRKPRTALPVRTSSWSGFGNTIRETRADLIRDAYAYAEEKHRDQLRRSGDPYFSHPVAVAKYLIEKSLDDELIATALLHDTVEDTPASVEEIGDRFGEEIARAVSGVTKLKDLRTGDDESRARNLRKFLQAAEGRREGAPREAGRPASQHADDQASAQGEAGGEGAGDARHLRPARGADRHAVLAGGP